MDRYVVQGIVFYVQYKLLYYLYGFIIRYRYNDFMIILKNIKKEQVIRQSQTVM